MLPWIHLDTAQIPGGGELKLMRRGDEYSIMSGAIELMSSRLSGSEKALATLSCACIEGRPKAQMLIGGLGMGFTLGAALGHLSPDAGVTVAELVPAVVRWARGPMAAVVGASLVDGRVTIREADVGDVIAQSRGAFDAILLDVDNGPGGLNRDANDRLYAAAGLNAARRALRPKGVLAVWSAHVSTAFTKSLVGAGFVVEEVPVRATGGRRGARHMIWLATAI